jgi:hypothetical protein
MGMCWVRRWENSWEVRHFHSSKEPMLLYFSTENWFSPHFSTMCFVMGW